MSTLPTNIDIAQAQLPVAYKEAKAALSECARIDECKTWANKAAALATYAKMADDDSLRKLADRIQARAVSRMGELLKQFDGRGDHRKSGDTPTSSRREVAEQAGISKDQQVQAVRVANVPKETFDALIESDNPPTVTQLAEMGKQTRAMTGTPDSDEPSPKFVRQLLQKFDGAIAELRWFFDEIEGRLEGQLLEHLARDPELREAVYNVADLLMYQLEQLSGRSDPKRQGLQRLREEASPTQSPPMVSPATSVPDMPDIPACLDRRPRALADQDGAAG